MLKTSPSKLLQYSGRRLNMIFLFIVIGLLFISSAEATAQGNLLVTPRRVVFDGSRRSIDMNLANTGQDTATYAISIVQIRMTEDGGFETITEPDPGQRFADKYIRFFPRSVTLAPNEAQVVKVQVTRRDQLEEGEYRSHFYFRAVPTARPLGEEEPEQQSNTISVRLTPVFGITIPVIIRVGEPTAKVTITNVKLELDEDTEPKLEITFNRSGNMSVYGDLKVDHVSGSGTVTRVAIANGIAIYTPNSVRKFKINLADSGEIDYSSGKLHITFSAPTDLEPQRLAESEFVL